MSAGRIWLKELYVGFLLFLLAFLYLSHLNTQSLNEVPSIRVISNNGKVERQHLGHQSLKRELNYMKGIATV